MEQSLAEITDKYTILKLKSKHGLNVSDELKEYSDELAKHKDVNYSNLSHINFLIWEVEQQISQEDSLRELGRYCMSLRLLNKKRIAAKNEITDKFGGGYREEKSY